MVETDKFIWGHIPKCGGDLVTDLFKQTGYDIKMILDPTNQYSKHDSFLMRKIRDRDLILTIRRLPTFMLSWSYTISKVGGAYPYHEDKLYNFPTKEQLINPDVPYGEQWYQDRYGPIATMPDHWLNYMLGDDLKLTRCARLEDIEYDFKNIVISYYPEYQDKIERVKIPHKVLGWKRPFNYNHNVKDHFTPEIIEKFYENNPRWAKLESQIYK